MFSLGSILTSTQLEEKHRPVGHIFNSRHTSKRRHLRGPGNAVLLQAPGVEVVEIFIPRLRYLIQ